MTQTATSDPGTFMVATLRLRAGKMAPFCELMGTLRKRAEARGWKLEGAWVSVIGRLDTVIDVWRVPDANSVPSMLAYFASMPDWPDLAPKLAEYVEEEVIQIMTRLPYSP